MFMHRCLLLYRRGKRCSAPPHRWLSRKVFKPETQSTQPWRKLAGCKPWSSCRRAAFRFYPSRYLAYTPHIRTPVPGHALRPSGAIRWQRLRRGTSNLVCCGWIWSWTISLWFSPPPTCSGWLTGNPTIQLLTVY